MEIKVGQIETRIEEGKKKKKRLSSSIDGGSGGRGGRRGGGGGDDGDDPSNRSHFEEIEQFRPRKLRVGMWFLLVVVLMTFGANECLHIFGNKQDCRMEAIQFAFSSLGEHCFDSSKHFHDRDCSSKARPEQASRSKKMAFGYGGFRRSFYCFSIDGLA